MARKTLRTKFGSSACVVAPPTSLAAAAGFCAASTFSTCPHRAYIHLCRVHLQHLKSERFRRHHISLERPVAPQTGREAFEPRSLHQRTSTFREQLDTKLQSERLNHNGSSTTAQKRFKLQHSRRINAGYRHGRTSRAR